MRMRVTERGLGLRYHSSMNWFVCCGFAVMIGAVAGCFPEYDPKVADLEDTSGGLGPVLESIEGNSVFPPSDGVIYFRNALVLNGQRFGENPAVSLRGLQGAPDFDDLEQHEQTDERIVVGLPVKLVPGQYSLLVTTDSGEVHQSLTILRGEAGEDGVAVLANVYTWDQFLSVVPDPAKLITIEDADNNYALRTALPDIAALATDEQAAALAELSAAETEYASITELPDPDGYLSYESATKKYAMVADLPITTNAIEKETLPKADSYVTKAFAQSQGVKLGQIGVGYYNKVEMGKFLPKNSQTLPSALDAQVAELVYAALTEKTCPKGTVPIRGDSAVCIDQHEARVQSGTCIDNPAKIHGQGPNDYGTLNADGSYPAGATKLVACSIGSGKPSAYITWYQAVRICNDSGGWLCSNDEWQMAATGTPDALEDPETKAPICMVAGSGPVTGESAECVANSGAFHMVGNVSEWTSDWMSGGHDPPAGFDPSSPKLWPPGQSAQSDAVVGWYGAGQILDKDANWYYGFPTPVVRGGSFGHSTSAGVFHIDLRRIPLASSAEVGFRCCRSR